jgi:hypothetical protein
MPTLCKEYGTYVRSRCITQMNGQLTRGARTHTSSRDDVVHHEHKPEVSLSSIISISPGCLHDIHLNPVQPASSLIRCAIKSWVTSGTWNAVGFAD